MPSFQQENYFDSVLNFVMLFLCNNNKSFDEESLCISAPGGIDLIWFLFVLLYSSLCSQTVELFYETILHNCLGLYPVVSFYCLLCFS